MSIQQQQQPNLVYPNTAISSSNPSHSSHSNGSFGPVFIVLAVIVVISTVACLLSRLCSKRHHHQSPKNHHEMPLPGPEKREPKHGHNGSFNDRGIGDIEFGFGKGLPNGKEYMNEEMGEGAKGKPRVRFEFGGDPKGVGEKKLKDGEFSAI